MSKPRFLRSLRWRVQLWHGVLLALVLGALAVREWDVWLDLQKRDLDNDIYRAAFLIDGALHGRSRPEGLPPIDRSLPLGEGAMLPEQRAIGMYYAIWRNGEEHPGEVSANAPHDLFKPTSGYEGLIEQTRPDLRAWFISSEPGQYVVTGRSLERDYVAWRWRAVQIAGTAAAIWLVVMIAGWWLVGRELRPVKVIATISRKIAAGDLAQRIRARENVSELGELSAVLDETFAKLDGAFARQARFTADAAHELRTPVSIILTHAQNALAWGGLPPPQRRAIESVERAAQRMRRMIESLLQLARLDAGKEGIAGEPVDLAQVAKEVADLLQPRARDRNVTLTSDLRPAIVLGNASALGQVVANLVGNAIHHGNERGSVRTTVRSNSSQAIVEISDDGPGIAPEHLPHIFDRFYRVDAARTGTSGRTGLGLAISRAIAEAHGGTLTVKSAPGQGSTFTLAIPVAR